MKTIMITESSVGKGKMAVLHFAEAGYEVIFHGRNPAKICCVS